MAIKTATGSGGIANLSGNEGDILLLRGSFDTLILTGSKYRVGVMPGEKVDIDRLVLNGCVGVQIVGSNAMRVIDKGIGTNTNIPLVLDVSGSDNIIRDVEVCHIAQAKDINNAPGLIALGDWTQLRIGIDLRSPNTIVEGCLVYGLRIGIQARGVGVDVGHNTVFRIGEDAIRALADDIHVHDNTIHDLMGADPLKHYDGIQMWQDGVPNASGVLRNIRIINNKIRCAKEPHGRNGSYSQGIIQTDGASYGHIIKGNRIDINSTHGVTLAEAHDCVIDDNVCVSTDGVTEVAVTLGTSKSGYGPSTNNKVNNNTAQLFTFSGSGLAESGNVVVSSADSFTGFTNKLASIC